jgi:hypothetical protein
VAEGNLLLNCDAGPSLMSRQQCRLSVQLKLSGSRYAVLLICSWAFWLELLAAGVCWPIHTLVLVTLNT